MRTQGRMTRALVLTAVLLSGLFAGGVALAHPHVWVTIETEVLYDGSKAMTGFRHKWTFDEFYTSFAIQGLDKNGDGIYSREELAELAEVNISSLNEFQYFTFPKIGKTVVDRLPPREYYLEHSNGMLTLYLTLPLAKPIPVDQMKDFSLVIYDPSFFVDFAFAKTNPVRLKDAPGACSATIKAPVLQAGGPTTLGEAFFSNADATAELASRYAKTVTIACPSS